MIQFRHRRPQLHPLSYHLGPSAGQFARLLCPSSTDEGHSHPLGPDWRRGCIQKGRLHLLMCVSPTAFQSQLAPPAPPPPMPLNHSPVLYSFLSAARRHTPEAVLDPLIALLPPLGMRVWPKLVTFTQEQMSPRHPAPGAAPATAAERSRCVGMCIHNANGFLHRPDLYTHGNAVQGSVNPNFLSFLSGHSLVLR